MSEAKRISLTLIIKTSATLISFVTFTTKMIFFVNKIHYFFEYYYHEPKLNEKK